MFYHLTEKTLDSVLPSLVERSLSRDWNVVIQSGSAEKLDAIDNLLWTYRVESFLPHGKIKDGSEHLQPVWLTTDIDNPNHAKIRFLVDHAQIDLPDTYERLVYIFDGHDNTAVEHARSRWKFHKENSGNHEQTYWQQNASGGWEKKA